MICRTAFCRTAVLVVLAGLGALALACSSTTPAPGAPPTDRAGPGAAGQPAVTPPMDDDGAGGAEGDGQSEPSAASAGAAP